MTAANDSWRWLPREVLIAVHQEQLAEHGGAPGLRDEGLFESALARAQNMATYGQPDVVDLAAAYAWGLVRNHPFIDGNKRTAFVAAQLFLRLNGYRIQAPHVDCVLQTLALAAGDLQEADFAAWLRQHLQTR
ncbi:type II toxin-antitoxin system death-on-curing family toxin [Comamonas sp. NLF-1-9]|uniref:type II toxin-antitoxin system death-on-curing family toxin n=1 Tax=Comamonas sp. NLF-1-9 TaxID=2853163 RepID=UPI001C45E513|nr:type II toxin-antitoxin system death-on-curing family toxin [Comamonas sp. NLF-1-9]QXL85340.1 type II toxin-antitoxin system death-on-curing family toxin [Comamonas sp. NLF-1-9]